MPHAAMEAALSALPAEQMLSRLSTPGVAKRPLTARAEVVARPVTAPIAASASPRASPRAMATHWREERLLEGTLKPKPPMAEDERMKHLHGLKVKLSQAVAERAHARGLAGRRGRRLRLRGLHFGPHGPHAAHSLRWGQRGWLAFVWEGGGAAPS